MITAEISPKQLPDSRTDPRLHSLNTRTKLNPEALEFRSDSSTSEVGSPVRANPLDYASSPPSVIMQPGPDGRLTQASLDYIMLNGASPPLQRSGSGQSRHGSRTRRSTRGRETQQSVRGASPPPTFPPAQIQVQPTRQLSIVMEASEEEGHMLEMLAQFGDISHIDRTRLAPHRELRVSFHDLRAALAAHDALTSPHPATPPRLVRFVPLDAASRQVEGGSDAGGEACPPEDPAQDGGGESSPPGCAHGILAVEVVEGTLSRDDMDKACAAYGDVCGVWGANTLYFVEYMDARDASKALAELELDGPEGCQLAVCNADLDPIVLLGRGPHVFRAAHALRGMMGGSPTAAYSPFHNHSHGFEGRASPPPVGPGGAFPHMMMPVMPAYSWGSTYPVFHCYPPEAGEAHRAASPPAVFPNGGSPPLPSGFISIPLRSGSGSLYGSSPPYPPPAMYGSSPPPYGMSPPFGPPAMYGSSPPHAMAGGPLPYMAHPPHMFEGARPTMSPAGSRDLPQGEFPQGQELSQRMAGMALRQGAQHGKQGQQDKPQRSDQRASARIARSNRAGGAYNPSEFAFDVEEAESGRADARTTVMVRNIPNKYTQTVVLEVLEGSGFKGQFDFFYLPIDFRNKCNLGYAFINFTSAKAAAQLYKQYHSKRWEEHNSKKVCEISYARVQGRDPLIEHFRASKFPSEELEYMPLVYKQVEGGAATDPVSIHRFLLGVSFGDVDTAGAAGAEAGAGAALQQAQAAQVVGPNTQ